MNKVLAPTIYRTRQMICRYLKYDAANCYDRLLQDIRDLSNIILWMDEETAKGHTEVLRSCKCYIQKIFVISTEWCKYYKECKALGLGQ